MTGVSAPSSIVTAAASHTCPKKDALRIIQTDEKGWIGDPQEEAQLTNTWPKDTAFYESLKKRTLNIASPPP